MSSTDYLMIQPNIRLEKYISSYKFINLHFSFKSRESIGKLKCIWRRQRCKVDYSMVEIWPRGHFWCSLPISLYENEVECMQMTVTPILLKKKNIFIRALIFYQSALGVPVAVYVEKKWVSSSLHIIKITWKHCDGLEGEGQTAGRPTW